MYIVIQLPLLEIEYNWEPKRLNQTWTNLLDSNRRHSNEPNKIYGEKCIPMTALCLDDFLLSKTNNLICYGLQQITMIAFQWDHCTCIYILLYIYMYIYIYGCVCVLVEDIALSLGFGQWVWQVIEHTLHGSQALQTSR